MILTQCAVCATDLGLSLGKKCGRCSTRYCGPECQKQHWEGGGHDKLCKKIKRAGGAEQHYADTKYSEAVTVSAEACADDTKGQTCFICTQALHWKTKEGLVRWCACRGTAGFAHVSCLAEHRRRHSLSSARGRHDARGARPGCEARFRGLSSTRRNFPGHSRRCEGEARQARRVNIHEEISREKLGHLGG